MQPMLSQRMREKIKESLGSLDIGLAFDLLL